MSPNKGQQSLSFSKTKICKFYLSGQCSRGTDCVWAHGWKEVRSLPDLSRTKLCRDLLVSGKCQDPACTFAHNKHELRTIASGQPRPKPEIVAIVKKPVGASSVSARYYAESNNFIDAPPGISMAATDDTPAMGFAFMESQDSSHRSDSVEQVSWPSYSDFDFGMSDSAQFFNGCGSWGMDVWASPQVDMSLSPWHSGDRSIGETRTTKLGSVEDVETSSGSGETCSSVLSSDGSIEVPEDDVAPRASMSHVLGNPMKLVRSAEGELCPMDDCYAVRKSTVKLVRSVDGILCAFGDA